MLHYFLSFFCMHHAAIEKDHLFISVALPGSGRGHNQANNKISLDQITSALVVNDTATFGAPWSQEFTFIGCWWCR